MSTQSAGRRARGRPAQANPGATREAIIVAARAQFASRGFAGASVRAIARDAAVDPSLIRHYFGDKAGLLVATMELPFNPLERIHAVVAGGPDGLAERLLRTFLGSWDPHRDVFSALFRTQIAAGDQESPVLMVMRNVVTRTLADLMRADDADLRAALVASQLLGMATLRYVVHLAPLATASIDEVVAALAGPMQSLIDGGAPGR